MSLSWRGRLCAQSDVRLCDWCEKNAPDQLAKLRGYVECRKSMFQHGVAAQIADVMDTVSEWANDAAASKETDSSE